MSVIGLLGISGYLSGRSWPTLSRLWKWMLVFIPMMIAGPVAFMSSCLSPLIRMKGLVTVLEVVTKVHMTCQQNRESRRYLIFKSNSIKNLLVFW